MKQGETPTWVISKRLLRVTSGNIKYSVLAVGKSCSTNVRPLSSSIDLNRYLPIAVSIALPGAFIITVQQFPDSWATRYHQHITNLLHLFLFLASAQPQTDIRELGFFALVMVSFDVFQRALDRDASTPRSGKSNDELQASSAAETLVTRTRSVRPISDELYQRTRPSTETVTRTRANTDSRGSVTKSSSADSKEDIVRLQGALTDLKTANKAKEVLLHRTREELKNARETLNQTFAEYCSLRDEMKTIKQTMARDHQAIVYRKDIELFALRKGNEQKENYIKDHDAKLDEVFQQQKATVELKDAQLRMLKERVAYLDRQASPKLGHDQEEEGADGDHALQVRLLRVKKPAKRREDSQPVPLDSTTATDEDKDATIASLREQLAVAKKTADEVVNQQAELSRAWDVVKKIQTALKEERKLHTQTREQLEEVSVRLEEEQDSRATTVGRLPTIEEDKYELEAMFDTAQEDNLRLYSELEALEKRLRDANIRMFTAEHEVVALREQVQLEQTISNDLETARPSVVHRVHFQRMEGQLKEVSILGVSLTTNQGRV
jgi:hypothetical protein